MKRQNWLDIIETTSDPDCSINIDRDGLISHVRDRLKSVGNYFNDFKNYEVTN